MFTALKTASQPNTTPRAFIVSFPDEEEEEEEEEEEDAAADE